MTVEGEPESSVLRTQDRPLLEEVASGNVPRAWKPKSTEAEAVFLAPLDVVVARERARTLFDFDYLWEVYKPGPQRRWGYYVLPVLLGGRLIGRIEPTIDRVPAQLRIERAWWEAGVALVDVAEPRARGLRRTLEGLDGSTIRLGQVGPNSFKATLTDMVRSLSTRS